MAIASLSQNIYEVAGNSYRYYLYFLSPFASHGYKNILLTYLVWLQFDDFVSEEHLPFHAYDSSANKTIHKP